MSKGSCYSKLAHLLRPVVFLTLLLTYQQLMAHPMEYHYRPLDAAAVERVLDSFDRMVIQLQKNGSLASARLPSDAMGVTAVVWSLQEAVLAIDDSTPAGSKILDEALAASGYSNPEIRGYEWQLEAERVLETYEALVNSIDMSSVNSGFAELEKDRNSLTEDEVREREVVLYRNEQLLRTTWKDLELVSEYRQRLDFLVGRLGAEVD
jgi:hypothetical protein